MFSCELCGCESVRYVHVMHNKDYFEDVSVGCICAGVMESDILQARERERLLRNRARRKQNYLKLRWEETANGSQTLCYKGEYISIICCKTAKKLGVVHGGKTIWKYKGKQIENFYSAVHAAFELVDPKIL